MPLAYFQARTGRVGRIISRTISDVDNIRVGVQDVAFSAVVHLGTMLGAAALMIYYDWLLFLVVLGMVPLLWRLLAHFRKRLSKAHRAVHESFSRVTSTLAESVTGVKVTQGFVREDINGGLFRQLIAQHSRNNMEVVRHSAVFLPLLEFNGQLFIAILLAVGGVQALAGDISVAVLVQFLFLSNLFFNPIPQLGNLYNQALTAMAAAERVWRLLDTPPAWTDAPDATAPATACRAGGVPAGVVRLRRRAAGAARGELRGRAGTDRRPGGPHRQRQEHHPGPDRQVPPAHRGPVADRRPGHPQHHRGRPAPADGQRAPEQLPVLGHGDGQRPHRAAGGQRPGDRRRRRGAGCARSDRGPAGGVRHPGGREGRRPVAGAAADRLLLPGDAGRPAHPAAGRGHQRGRPR